MTPLQLFFGHDERQVVGTNVFMRSVVQHARRPVAMIPVTSMASAVGLKEGTNAFTYRRFLVPWMMDFHGMAVFVDGSDMLCRTDINELADLYDPYMAVQVVKHEYTTRHPMKYCGTQMEAPNTDYPRKNWASCMIINCSHRNWRQINPEYVNKASGMHMLGLEFVQDRFLGDLPLEWNWLVDEHGENQEAKLIHFTAGIPGMPHYQNSPMADEWHAALLSANSVSGS